MKYLFSGIACILMMQIVVAQNKKSLTPDMLWKIGRVSARGITKDKKYVIYTVSNPQVSENKFQKTTYKVDVNGGAVEEVKNADELLPKSTVSPDGKYILSDKEVLINEVKGSDKYKDLPQSNAYVITSLNYRHWDKWEDGKFNHVFFAANNGEGINKPKDIMPGKAFDCPTKPFGGDDDYIWNPDSKHILYVTKPKEGTAYTISTNTDLFEYDIATGTTKNLTENNRGYDLSPAYSVDGKLAWLQMKRDGYEADKQDIAILYKGAYYNLTQNRDDIHVEGFKWSDDGKAIFFTAPLNGTLQLFKIDHFVTANNSFTGTITQVTSGDFDVAGIVGEIGGKLVVSRDDMNHTPELYTVDLASGKMTQLTHVNDAFYAGLNLCKTERKFVETTDKQKMLEWIIYPPNFDPAKKYPTILYCQGGPQSPLTQFYSFRWNFQLMASQGYIIVAPNRRGMPGYGTKWNEDISKDWGGQVMNDYLSAIDDAATLPFVNKSRLGCIGASFGGFSVFALEGLHNGRFKTFIAHDGVFDFRSMFGTTDEMWFEYWEKGGAYWEKNNAVAQKSFAQSPSNFVDKWNTPIMIVQGGKDYRVPIEQGQQAFQAAQLKGIKSKFLYLPDENHWVMSPQNALVWQREFYEWLKETL
jgi:dipeptidyl aminopeptidase/acylaminoacyl peptidase